MQRIVCRNYAHKGAAAELIIIFVATNTFHEGFAVVFGLSYGVIILSYRYHSADCAS